VLAMFKVQMEIPYYQFILAALQISAIVHKLHVNLILESLHKYFVF